MIKTANTVSTDLVNRFGHVIGRLDDAGVCDGPDIVPDLLWLALKRIGPLFLRDIKALVCSTVSVRQE